MAIAYLGYRVDSGQVAKAEKRLDKMSGAAGVAGKAVAGFAAAAAAAFSTGAIVRGISQFETSMSRVGAVSRASTKDLEAMRKVAIRLGTTTEFSASQAADGLNFLAMAGFDARESMEALPQVLDLATASGMGLARSADIASNVISGFGLAASDAAEVADALAAASSRANTDVGQLGQAMSTVAPIAASLDMSVQEAAAAIGVLSDAGIQGARAGTAMRGVLASLAGPTDQAREAIEAYGLALEDVNPETNSLAEIMGRLEKAGLTTADAMTIFGREAASGALALVDANERVGELTGQLNDAEGAAGDMADTMRDNLGGDIKGLMSALEGLILALGEAGLTAVLRGVVKLATGLVRAFSKIVDATRKAATALGDFFKLTDAQDRLQRSIDNSTIAMGDQITEVQTLDALLGNSTTITLQSAKAHLDATLARRDEISAIKEKQELLAKEKLGWDQLSVDIARARDEYQQLQDVQLRAKEQGIDLPGITGDQASLAAEIENAERNLAQLLSRQQDYKRTLEGMSYLSPENQSELDRLNKEIKKTEDAIKRSSDGLVDFNSEVVKANGLSGRLGSILSNIPGYVSAGSEGASVLAKMLSGAARAAAAVAKNLASAASYLPGIAQLGQALGNVELPGAFGEIGNQLKGVWQGVMRQVNAPDVSVPEIPGGGGGGGGGGDAPTADLSAFEALREKMQTEREMIEEWRAETVEATNLAREQEVISQQEHNNYMLEIERLYQDQLSELERKKQRERLEGHKGALGDLASLMQSENKKLFAIGKAASIAQATIKGYEAATDAWAKGMKIGGPALAAAYTAASLARTGMLISKIASTSAGGGASGAGGGSSGGASAASASTQPREPQRSVRIEVEGEGMFADMLRDNVDQIADAIIGNTKQGGAPIVVGR